MNQNLIPLMEFLTKEQANIKSYIFATLANDGQTRVHFQGNVLELCFIQRGTDQAVNDLLKQPLPMPQQGKAPTSLNLVNSSENSTS